MYQHRMHTQLATYRNDMNKKTKDDLRQLNGEACTLFVGYQARPDSSIAAQTAFYQDLYQSMSQYYRTTFYDKKSRWEKFKYHFGLINKSEANFLDTKRAARKEFKRCQKQSKKVWQVSSDFKLRLRLSGENMEMVTHPSRETKSKIFGARKWEYNLRLASHWLMGENDFSKYAFLQGSSSAFMAYKLKRELEKFRDLYKTQLSTDHMQQLLDAISMLDAHLKIQGLITLHAVISQTTKNNYSQARLDDIAYHACSMLLTLANGEKLLLPHGYKVQEKDSHSGHAALVEVTKAKDDDYQPRFINTGSGAYGKQDCESMSQKMSYLLFGERPDPKFAIWRVDGVKFDQLAQGDLVKDILAPVVIPEKNQEKAVKKMLTPMATFIDQDKLKEDTKIKLQKNGTCTHSVLIAWLQTVLDEDLFEGFELFAVRRANVKLTKIATKEELRAIPEFDEANKKLTDAGKDLQSKKVRQVGRKFAVADDDAKSSYQAIQKKIQKPADMPKQIDDEFIGKCRAQLAALKKGQGKPGQKAATRNQAEKLATKALALFSADAKKQAAIDDQGEQNQKQAAVLSEVIDLAEKHCVAAKRAAMLNIFINPPQTNPSTGVGERTPRAHS